MDEFRVGAAQGHFSAQFLDMTVDGSVSHDPLVGIDAVHQLLAGADLSRL